MENLSRYQLILLVLLISFVTSIATGIMTVSLLQQAPVEVTRNINSVVERTIETVAPSAITSSIVTAPKSAPAVESEDDQIVASINENANSVVRIYQTDSLGAKSFYGIGTVMSKDGVIGANRETIVGDDIYTAVFGDGSEFKLVPMGVDKDTASIFFRVNLPPDTKYVFSPVSIAGADLQLGQTVIGIGGDTQNASTVGRVSSLDMKNGGEGTTTTKYISAVETDVSTRDLVAGSPFFDLSGDLVGIKLSDADSGTFTPVAIVLKELNIINQ
jgi:S1-C subfamily serine protease